jgi:hypothetical protein
MVMNPFELFECVDVYKFAILYFSRSRGLAIVGRYTSDEKVEVIQISGEVDPHTGNFTALDYFGPEPSPRFPVITKQDFENLVSYIESKIDAQTRMSIIDPDLLRSVLPPGKATGGGAYLH